MRLAWRIETRRLREVLFMNKGNEAGARESESAFERNKTAGFLSRLLRRKTGRRSNLHAYPSLR